MQKTRILHDEEFDNFLKTEKERSFTVVCNFKSFYQDIVLFPPVKGKYYKTVIETEIRKKAADLKDFSFFYKILGEKYIEGKARNEAFVFAVDNEELFGIINKFEKHGKTVSRLYPNALTLSYLVQSTENLSNEPVLCVAASGTDKILFLMKKGNLLFLRTIHSQEGGLHDIDIQNINMSINYIRQTLRLTPSQIILTGIVDKNDTTNLLVPVADMKYPHFILAPNETLKEFIVPISAILYAEKQSMVNLLPQSYRNIYYQKRLLAYCTIAFLFFSAISLWYLKMNVSNIFQFRDKIRSLRVEIMQKKSTYCDDNRYQKLQKFMPLINFMNVANASPDFQKALITLECLNMKNVDVQSIQIDSEGQTLHLQIKGGITANNLANMQMTYQGLLEVIKKRKEIELISDKIDLKDKNFSIAARYRSN
ncbi:MAG: hypothetical protein ACK41Q_07775 [Candidatus Brocadia sp.]